MARVNTTSRAWVYPQLCLKAPKNQVNQTNSQTSSITDIGKISASPTASNAALLADVTVFKFSEGKTTSFQTGNAFNINEQKGESTSINNGTRNTLSDSSNAQFIDQRGITNGRSSSDSISDQDASTHTASNGTESVRISVSGEVIPGAAQRGCPLYLRCSMPDLMR